MFWIKGHIISCQLVPKAWHSSWHTDQQPGGRAHRSAPCSRQLAPLFTVDFHHPHCHFLQGSLELLPIFLHVTLSTSVWRITVQLVFILNYSFLFIWLLKVFLTHLKNEIWSNSNCIEQSGLGCWTNHFSVNGALIMGVHGADGGSLYGPYFSVLTTEQTHSLEEKVLSKGVRQGLWGLWSRRTHEQIRFYLEELE